jgi:hypothetical protein
MRIRCLEESLPRRIRSHPKARGVISAADIRVTGGGRLRLKVVVFANKASLHHFWKAVLGKPHLGRTCCGAVNGLAYERIEIRPGRSDLHTLVVDPRYFAIMGLVKGYLNMEIVTHEATHAAFAYARRHHRDMWVGSGDLEEENVCYPAGRIAKSINAFLHEEGLYP